MARVTVEDCLDKVSNRFTLVALVSKRVRQFIAGDKPLVESDNKQVVTALREVEAGLIQLNKSQDEIKVELEILLKGSNNPVVVEEDHGPVEAPKEIKLPPQPTPTVKASTKKAEASVTKASTKKAEASATPAPDTQAPVTKASATPAPVTQAPVTKASATPAPVIEASATPAPVTAEAPVTKASATPAPEEPTEK